MSNRQDDSYEQGKKGALWCTGSIFVTWCLLQHEVYQAFDHVGRRRIRALDQVINDASLHLTLQPAY